MARTPIPRQSEAKPARKRERRPSIGLLIRQAEQAGKHVTAAVRHADGTTQLTFAGPADGNQRQVAGNPWDEVLTNAAE